VEMAKAISKSFAGKNLKLHEATTKKAIAIFLLMGETIRHVEAENNVTSISLR